MVRLWGAFVQNPNPGLPAAPTARVEAAEVEPGQRLRIRNDGNVHAMLADGGELLSLIVGTSREVELTGSAVRFVQRMLGEREFTASDCLAWSETGTPFAWDDVQFMLTNLKREGLIEDVAEAG